MSLTNFVKKSALLHPLLVLRRRLKTKLNIIKGLDFSIKKDIKIPSLCLGSGYGGWCIIPREINKDSIIYSVGIGEDVSFDIALIEKFNVTLHAFDPTPKSIKWIEQLDLPQSFVMHPIGLSNYDGEASFCPPDNPEHVSHTMIKRSGSDTITVKVVKLATIMKDLNHDHIDLLKMDIEGAEFDVIEDMIKSNIRPKQLLIEFHHRFPEIEVETSRNAIESLRKIGYKVYSVSPTNEEICFYYDK
ncbi:hypothetical protein KS4_15880 [Poriferisphaera corsica]|uniref:Methyltransferase FkbM domain-containing protein n=1 Tax=Poriferisphaera corsica TaxID=2528020 RepID=A0A517YTJ2_9BACT|nr:FkbM family methyltransferase [Poriferisphaera corsica]QDU33538.1 hypothetical protein KS4_15880 [Poriferisphaera corsica]